jgi:hypothetical protein
MIGEDTTTGHLTFYAALEDKTTAGLIEMPYRKKREHRSVSQNVRNGRRDELMQKIVYGTIIVSSVLLTVAAVITAISKFVR